MDMKSVCFCVLVFSLQFVCGQYSTTPCPGTFDFENDGQNVYGKITVRPQAPVSSLELRINFTIAARLINNNYVGQIDALNSNTFLQRYNRGQTVNYLVHFPVTSPLPKLTALTINGDTICYGPGDMVRPNGVYITTLSLTHTAFLEGGAGAASDPFNNYFQPQPQTRPQIRPQQRPQEPIRDDEAVAPNYTFNNIESIWTTGNSPNYVVNNTNPFTQVIQQYQPPTQSRPIYYDESVYQAPNRRPMRPLTPVYTEPLTNRPVHKPAPVTNPDDFYPPETPSAVTTSTDRYSNRPDETIECGIVSGGNSAVPLVHNGETYDRGEIPWLVAIYKTKLTSLQFICGGTLVSDRHIVTAAHCMQRRGTITSMESILVKLGIHNLNEWSNDFVVVTTLKKATIHENYNAHTLQNDILVLTIIKAIKFNDYIRPACLWSGNTDQSVVVGRNGVVAGWGDQGVGGQGQQAEPRKVKIPIVSTNDCRASKSQFHELTYENTLCAGDRKGSGPCTGDSGGGMYLLEGGKWRVRGIVSQSLRPEIGNSKCNLNEYVVFTDAAQFVPWIKHTLAQN